MRQQNRWIIAACLAVAMPMAASAQDAWSINNGSTGLTARSDRSAPGYSANSPKDLKSYVKMVRAVEMAVNFQTKSRAPGGKHTLGPLSLAAGMKVEANVRFSKKGDVRLLESLDIKPSGGKMELDGMNITRVRFDRKGELTLELKGKPDLHITKIEKKRNGETKLTLRGLPDITIKKNGDVKMLFFKLGKIEGDFEFPDWPISLEGLMKTFGNKDGGSSEEGGLAKAVGTVDWNMDAVIDAPRLGTKDLSFPPGTGRINMGGSLAERDGELVSVGEANKLRFRADFEPGDNLFGRYNYTADEGWMTLDGKYRVALPLKPGKKLFFDFDGNAAYKVDGRKVDLRMPNGTRIYAGGVESVGSTKLGFNYDGGKTGFEVKDGRYDSTFSGPIKIERVNTGGLSVDALELDGTIHMGARVRTKNKLLVNTVKLDARAKVTTGGAVAILRGEDPNTRTRIEAGSEIVVDLDRFTTFRALDGSVSDDPRLLANANISGRTQLDLILGETDVKSGDNAVHIGAGENKVKVDAEFNLKKRDGNLVVRRASGTASVELGADGVVKVGTKEGPETGRVTASRLNVRTGPGTSHSRIDAFAKDTPLTILKEKDGWYLVKGKNAAGREEKGYVSAEYVKRDGSGPAALSTGLRAGSRVDFDLSSLRTDAALDKGLLAALTSAKAGVKARVLLSDTEVAVGGLKARILGDGAVDLDGIIGAERDLDGELRVAPSSGVRMSFRLALKNGSQIMINKPGSSTNVTINGPTSFIDFDAEVRLGADGKPVLREVTKANIRLELDSVSTSFLGNSVTLPGEKVINLKDGRIVFRDDGIDIFGELGMSVRSAGDRPAVSIRWGS